MICAMMNIELIPAFNDNYIFLITFDTGAVAVVDPGDEKPVIEHLEKTTRRLDYILLTHHHDDHIGGAQALKDRYGASIIGHEKDSARLPRLDKAVNDDDIFKLENNTFKVIETPGHTIGHICYYCEDEKVIFVGDTLFVMGCGRLFEGTPDQMFGSLSKITELPDNVQIYCAHEYTLANAAFALDAFPNNDDIKGANFYAEELRKLDAPTVPTTIGSEKKTNPFLLAKTAEEFAALRQAKDSF